MKCLKYMMLFIMLVLGLALVFYVYYKQSNSEVEAFNFDRDAAKVDELFHKGDNWYWMISNSGSATFSMDFALRYQSSSQFEKKYDLVLKVLKIDGNLAGFLAYYKKSAHVWHLLFLVVDQDYRRQGVAKKMLKFAIDDMISRGAIKIDLATRNNNFKSQSLYKKSGFKQTHSDDEFVFLSRHK